MLMKRELEVARRIATTPQIIEALGLAQEGEMNRAGHLVDDYLRQEDDLEVGLFVRREMIGMKGASGRPEEAAKAASECVEEAIRLWGAADERTLIMRNTELYWTGQAGLQRRAEFLADTLMADARAALDRHDQLNSAIRNNSARVYEVADNHEQARSIYEALLADFDASPDPKAEAALVTRRNYAEYLCAHHEYEESLEVYRYLLLQITEVWGARSEDALSARLSAAQVTLSAGDEDGATEQLEILYRDCAALLGRHHLLTIETLNYLVAIAASQEAYATVVKWLEIMIPAVREQGGPELLFQVIHVKNRYAEMMVAQESERGAD